MLDNLNHLPPADRKTVSGNYCCMRNYTHTHPKFHRDAISGIPVGYDSSDLPAALLGHVIITEIKDSCC